LHRLRATETRDVYYKEPSFIGFGGIIVRKVERADRQRRAVIAMGILLACCRCVWALNPSLSINRYAHTAWTARESFFKGAINAIAQTPDGYLGTQFGLLRFDGLRSVPWQPPAGEHLPSSFIQSLLATRDGRLWIGTAKGLASWKNGKLTQYPELAGQGVLALLEDHGETVWAGVSATPIGRLCAIRRGSVQCFGQDGSLGREVKSLFEDRRGNLWAVAETGLWQWNPGPPKLYRLSSPAPEIHALIEGDNGALLVSTRGRIIQLVHVKAEAYPLPGAGPQFNPFHLLQDRDGGFWIGTRDRGLLHMHQGRTDLFAQSDGLSGDHINTLFEDREGNIWVVTVNGLDRFRDFAAATISVSQGLSNADAVSVLAARDGSVWIGTRDDLNRWNDGQSTIYRKGSSGLPDDGLQSLFQDDRGRIWAFTGQGLAYLKGATFVAVTTVRGGRVHFITGDKAVV
jgi:ligand-binding sensor domain-containing protein